MPEITISPPGLGVQAYFGFKEPVLSAIRNRLNTNEGLIALKVIGINDLKSLIEAELRDPFVDAYSPLGISSEDYKRYVLNGVPLYVFAYTPAIGRVVYLKCPLNYINEHSLVSDILYTNRVIVMDLAKLPKDLSTVEIFQSLSNLVFDTLGVRPEIKEVSVGEPEKTTRADHALRESIRTQAITLRKSERTRLAEITLKHDQLMARLDDLNITLG
jgi:hypothetical protein